MIDRERALVTGGSRGIGRAIALALAARGCEVLVHYRAQREAALEVSPRVLQADVGSTDSISRMVAEIADSSIDILVNNAGVWKPSPLGSTTEERVDELLGANLKGLFWITQAMLPKLRPGARIINISSTAARAGIAGGRSLYGASKAAVDSLTRSWALELAPRGIRVNAVAPGYVETDMTAEHLGDPARRENALNRHPLGRFGQPGDVAGAVIFLCSEEGSFITGQSLNVSGGFVV